MTSFAGIPSELMDAITYELDAIDFLRGTQDGQSETPAGTVDLVIGDLTPDGIQRMSAGVTVHSAVSEGAVKRALARFRPLAFSASFKLQDMIAEWILRANGSNEWAFKKKIAAYDHLQNSSALIAPSFFRERPDLASAFWNLYRFLIPFRSALIHAGGVVLESDGTIVISQENGNELRLTAAEQASYMRAMCVISKVLVGLASKTPYLIDLIESDFVLLHRLHGQPGLSVRYARLSTLNVQVPSSRVRDWQPLSFDVDFDHLRRSMEKILPVSGGGRLYFGINIVVEDTSSLWRWQIPIEAQLAGIATVMVTEPAFDRWLQITRK